jgi:hypothetical protein
MKTALEDQFQELSIAHKDIKNRSALNHQAAILRRKVRTA